MNGPRNHPKPELVDPFDLPEEAPVEAEARVGAPAPANAPATIDGDVDAGDRVELRPWRRVNPEKLRHATG